MLVFANDIKDYRLPRLTCTYRAKTNRVMFSNFYLTNINSFIYFTNEKF